MFCLIPNILILLILIKTINTASIDSVSISFNVLESYNGGSNVQIVIKNNGNSPICSVKFFMSLPSGSVTQSNRNVRLRGNNKYRTPDNVKIDPGSSYNEAGVVIKGNGKPTLYVLDVDECSSGNSDNHNKKSCSCNKNVVDKITSTTEINSNNNTTDDDKITSTTEINSNNNTTDDDKITSTTEINSNNNTTDDDKITSTTEINGIKVTTESSLPSGDTLVVDPDSSIAKNMCISMDTAAGVIDQQINKPINNGKFTFYGAGGRGACGYNSDDPPMSAAASGSLFDKNAKSVPSCFSDNRYVLNDKICVNKCVKIEYKGKTLTVPITNQCPECELNHVDLSIPAFNWLEPLGGVVGIATNAVITYLDCGSQ